MNKQMGLTLGLHPMGLARDALDGHQMAVDKPTAGLVVDSPGGAERKGVCS
eukprot:CAMPEP_0115363054 /NCGR_PEP_ID=MMETSP0270-20121206/103020_1 /TAXON_ID=71861 /ORGANISM="Scrippsiella trochoidea, Strain CCMP3099" /LENGTH=50 /DNA_ID=CAMNT_0002785639 /DNA_START=99 /DNA_END=251 /DNA_ORIENTATION=-